MMRAMRAQMRRMLVSVTLTATRLDGGTEVLTFFGAVAGDGTVFIQSHQPGVGVFDCNAYISTFVVAAVDAGGTTATDAEPAPC